MNSELPNTPLFKVKFIDIESPYLTVGKEYDVIEVGDGFYKVKNDSGITRQYYDSRFEIVETPSQEAQEFSEDDVSFVDSRLDYHLLSPQEVVQATLDGKELEIQYTDGTWDSMSPVNTTLHQLTTLNFRLKPSLEDKRKAVIKKLLTTKVAVLCKCWDGDVVIREVIVAITKIDDGCTYSYMNNCLIFENGYAIDDNGDEITSLE